METNTKLTARRGDRVFISGIKGEVQRVAGDSALVLWDDGQTTWCDRSDLVVVTKAVRP